MKAKYFLFLILAVFIILLALIFTPVPAPKENNVDLVQGVIEKVYEPCCLDVSFKLKGDKRNYYVNRGLERGLNIDELNQKLQGKQVQLKIIQHWTPLDWNKSLGSIAEVKANDEMVFSAFN